MTAIERLVAIADPYGPITPADDALFAEAMAECDAWHLARNPRYAKLWDGDERPLVPVGLFKQVDLGTPVDDEGAWLSSSGTTSGTGTRVFFDRITMERIRRAMMQVFLANRLVDFQPANFLLLSPDPSRGNHPGYATTFDKFTGCAPVKERVFAVDDEGRFRPEVALEALRRWADSPSPIFLFGLTVYFEQLALCGAPSIELRGSVRGLTGGGWKGMVKRLGRDEIIGKLHELLRAPSVDLRDLFGLTEHPVHYISCTHGKFHIPKYARFGITGGEPGLIRLASPLFASLPSHDLLTEDIGARGEHCACGGPLPYLTFLGRATPSDGTCAHTAATR
jgi:Acyl-protein synthetase, LuxE